jgi:hypothetical protein
MNESATTRCRRSVVSVALAALVAVATGRAAEIKAGPTDYRPALRSLKPGDTLVLSSGVYRRGLPLRGTKGTAGAPIVIRGPHDQSAVFKAADCCNTVQLADASHVEVRNLTLDGAGTSGPSGVDARGLCHDITIENLRIVNYGANQQIVGISTKGPAWNWVIRRNTIVGAGTGMYLGRPDGTAPFINGLIEYNVVLDTLGYNLQIKHQLPRPADRGLPVADSRTIIRHNVWSKQRNASPGRAARPNVLVGHFPLSGTGKNDRYEIYGNFFYQNPVHGLFQGEGNIVLHDNLFVNAGGSAVNIRPHHDRPREVAVYHNTVVATGAGIRIRDADPGSVQRIVANAVFAGSPISGPNQEHNVTGSYLTATDYLTAPLAPIGMLDLYPKPGALPGVGDLPGFDAFTDGNRDFNGVRRVRGFVGAYEGEGKNPGWPLALAIKGDQFAR